MIKDIYGNTAESNYTMDFFRFVAGQSKQVFLAAPFFSTYEPIKYLTDSGCEVCIIVRLCQITSPEAIRKAVRDPLVKIRYYTGQKFHAKFYIAENVALVGSANLTDAGLKANREMSVTVWRDEHPAYVELVETYKELWDAADVINESILESYTAAFESSSRPKIDNSLDKFLVDAVPQCDPPSVVVGSRKVSSERLFLQNFRRRYDEMLVPAIDEVEAVFEQLGVRHPEFVSSTIDIEISRFLGWLRIEHAPSDTWRETELVGKEEREARLTHYIRLWISEENVAAGDMYSYDTEIANIERIRAVFQSAGSIAATPINELIEALTGCHAFLEQLRFTKGGLENLKLEFLETNSEETIKDTLSYLLHGSGDQIQRAYDCIFESDYKLRKFGESCAMELVGWMDPKRPPINGRTIKALRFIGFDAR